MAAILQRILVCFFSSRNSESFAKTKVSLISVHLPFEALAVKSKGAEDQD